MKSTAASGDSFLDEDKSLACIHCGLCLSACPTYLETGNENDSPRGRIYLMRAVQDGRVPLNDTTVRHIDLCLGCRACETACPSGVRYGELLESARDHVEKRYRRSFFQTVLRRIAIERVFPFSRRLKLALRPAQFLKRMEAEYLLPSFLRDTLALVPVDANAVAMSEFCPTTIKPKRGQVAFIEGCAMSAMFGRTNEATVKLLNRAGYDVWTPPGQGCCGALHAHNGRLDEGRECARRNIAAFEPLEFEAIIINAAGCGSTLKEYGHLLKNDNTWMKRAGRFSAKVKDLTEFLAGCSDLLDSLRIKGHASRVTYHDACHLAHPQRITKPPRDLIKAVAGNNFVELPESDLCCGSAGTYNLTEPEMAERLQRRKVQNILRTGADIVITTNPGCILQIQAGLKSAGINCIRVCHIADYLAEFALTSDE